MNYEDLLEKGLSEVPESSLKKERFEIPNVTGHIEGNKTIITNFLQIAKLFNRNADHLLKFILRELASPGSLDGNRLVLGRKISSVQINEKIEMYAKTFVICKECGKPDTQIYKEDKVNIMRCAACGARHIIKTKI